MSAADSATIRINKYTLGFICLFLFLCGIAEIGYLLFLSPSGLFADAKAPSPYEWQAVSPNPEFSIRDGASLVSFKGKLFLFGGWRHLDPDPIEYDVTNQIWVLQDDGKSWKLAGRADWLERHGAGAVVFKDKIWLMSGDGNTDVWQSADGLAWKKVTDNAPWGKRYAPYVAVFKDRLWLMGGLLKWDKKGNFVNRTLAANDVWSSEDGVNWTLVTDHAQWPSRGMIHGHVVHQGKLWIMGGGNKGNTADPRHGETVTEYNDVWSTEDGKNWTRVLAHAPWRPRTHFSVATFDGKIFITDGSVGTQRNLTNETWFSEDGIHWQSVSTPWKPRHASSLAVHEGALYIAQGAYNKDVWALRKKP